MATKKRAAVHGGEVGDEANSSSIGLYDPCRPPEFGLLLAISAEIGRLDDSAMMCIKELIDSCLAEGGFMSPLQRMALRQTVMSLGGREESQRECISHIVQFLRLPESPDLRRLLMMQGYLEHARFELTACKEKAGDCAGNWIQTEFWSHLNTANDAVLTNIGIASDLAAGLRGDLLSCDCAVEMAQRMSAMRAAFHSLKRGCCVLLCELDRERMFDDACTVVFEARFLEGVRHIASANRLLDHISGAPPRLEPEVDRAKHIVAEIAEKPKISDHTRQELRKILAYLDQYVAYDNSQARGALARQMMETADGLYCSREIAPEISRLVAAFFRLECRAKYAAPTQPADDLFIEVDVEVETVRLREIETGKIHDHKPSGGLLRLPWAGRSVEITTLDCNGATLDTRMQPALIQA